MTNYLIIFLASFLIWIMYLGIFLLWVIDGRIKKEVALHALVASVIAWVVAEMIKSLFPSLRPFAINGYSALVVWLPMDGSFPSGHTASAFALALTVWLHNKKWGWFYVICALLVGTARVIGNVHFPLDIAGGIVIGVITAFVVEKLHLYKLISRA